MGSTFTLMIEQWQPDRVEQLAGLARQKGIMLEALAQFIGVDYTMEMAQFRSADRCRLFQRDGVGGILAQDIAGPTKAETTQRERVWVMAINAVTPDRKTQA